MQKTNKVCWVSGFRISISDFGISISFFGFPRISIGFPGFPTSLDFNKMHANGCMPMLHGYPCV
jgi:hypothetical protein